MMSPETISALARKAARKAAREHRQPLIVEAEDCVTEETLSTHLRHGIPNFGTYRPRGWDLVPRAELKAPESFGRDRLHYLGCSRDFVFVDASGFGAAGEPALTQDEFMDLVAANPGLGWAVVEAGQFQVVVGAFRHKPPRRRSA